MFMRRTSRGSGPGRRGRTRRWRRWRGTKSRRRRRRTKKRDIRGKKKLTAGDRENIRHDKYHQ